MDENFKKAEEILKQYNQEHLLAFYDELNNEEKQALTSQICRINFKQIFDLYEASKIDEVIPTNSIEPLSYTVKSKLSKSEISSFENIGLNAILTNKCALVTLAGGQGTRLGCKGPKGVFKLDIRPKKSLFEIACDSLKQIKLDYNVIIPWYIMTSISNYKETIDFFEVNNYFNYPKNSVFFFKQNELPLIDIPGNLLLEEPYKVLEASNGNGDVFGSMKQDGIIDDMKQKGINWVFFSGIDNVILNTIDPLFLGLTIAHNKETASKTLFKQNPQDKDWIFARRNGKPAIINCSHLTDEMAIAKDENGNYLYREINILAHLFSLSAIEKVAETKLPYHRAFKKNTFVNDEGMKEVPGSPNTFKFENFIFDAFSLFDDIELLRVERLDEFAPIKDFNGPNNPEVAKELYENKFQK